MAQAYGHITQEQDEEEDRGGERMNYGGSGRNTGISLGLSAKAGNGFIKVQSK